MSRDKIIDLDPSKRLTKEAIQGLITTLESLKPDSVDSFILFYSTKDGMMNSEVFGTTWSMLGYSQAAIDSLRYEMYEGDSRIEDT